MGEKILGLDLGTNSIGWALINGNIDNEDKIQLKEIEAAGSRIIPMDAAILGDFNKGNSTSQTAERTRYRGVRRLRERHLLRRERLHRVLDLLGFLPEHYTNHLDRHGKFSTGIECKLPWKPDENGIHEFIFKDSFNEMLFDFATHAPELVAGNKKVPYDWTLYYLRKKALTQKIKKEELAWILLNFNQKRGYYQLRGEEEKENSSKLEEFYALKVVKVEDSGEKKGKDSWYNIHLENGMIYRRTSATPLEWEGKIKEFIVTTDIDAEGNPKKDKEGNIKRSFRAPKEEDWTLSKKRTEADIEKSGETVGRYIYDTLLQNPSQKIRGKLLHTIERKYYRDELQQILKAQIKFHPELQNKELYTTCIQELYPNNEAHRNNIAARDFIHLFMNDIIFYQRPLKSKKSLIENCPYEQNTFVDTETGEIKTSPIKCIAKSHPLFQEFRLWQFISNIRIYQKEGENAGVDIDVTRQLLPTEEDYAELFSWLNDKKEIDQKNFLKYPAFHLKNKAANYRWNYVEEKTYPCNETHAQILAYLEKAHVAPTFLTREKEEALWHILYSVEDKQEIEKALRSFARKNNLNAEFADVFKKFPPFKKEYGAYSAKAIKKLLPLMRSGKYWNETAIDAQTKTRIDKIIAGEYDDNIRNRVREKAINLTSINDFHSLPTWLTCYIVYNRHSEMKDITRWKTPADIDDYLQSFKQHSLRNPIVEQVITETLRTVRDIWKQAGRIDEIHVELGREMKNPSGKRADITRQILENENTNLRVKMLLTEFINPEFEIENVRPYSPSQQDILRIYEDTVLNSTPELPEDISSILDKFKQGDTKRYPSRSEILRYKLWLEQKYVSPYTGEVIPLGKLFTPAYEIEHIIPQARYFDDSFSNKVICEAEVNKLKSNCLGYEFIKKHPGEKVYLGSGKTVEIFSVEAYERFAREHYSRNRGKMKKLLMEDIPEQFIARQLNDSRYISKVVTSLLSNIVREEGEEEALSKNVIVCTGGVTDRLKKDWGVNDVWNKIILPRFVRLNEITGCSRFTSVSANGHIIPSIPLELQKGFNKKRIDHRHHAMDAIVIACANRNIVNYLNNQSASNKAKVARHDLQSLLCTKYKTDDKGNYKWILNKPWETFTRDMQTALQNIIVSFKQNLRVINKTTNHYLHYENGKKVSTSQTKGTSWAIRKPMHKETVFGEVNLRKIKTVSLKEAIKQPQTIVEKDLKKKLIAMLELGYDSGKIKKYFEDNRDVWQDINLSKIEVYYFTRETKDRYFATRKPLDTTFTRKKIIEEITDTGIQKILLRHLEENNDDPNLAFSPDGIDAMNRDIKRLNDGTHHQPIYKVRWYEKADKFAVGQSGNKSSKFVEAAKGTNLFFAIYETESVDPETGTFARKRTYATIPLNTVIDRQKKGLSPAPEDANGDSPKYILSPNDLIYLPTAKEVSDGEIHFPIDRERVYKTVSATGNRCFFIKAEVAKSIVDKMEFSSMNKMERAITREEEMIKEICLPLKIDRLGNIIKIGDFKPE
ncbi:type II CRISPR RNA-guided endonuclease Cas9 [Butyricimonas hominis]|uniref:type II CRISPR RNA-guided endonuclease Cas9 n=1 Tax=Butyricimonas TaxID=574697 RepID=UPI0035138230